jgi:hypothetical protein
LFSAINALTSKISRMLPRSRRIRRFVQTLIAKLRIMFSKERGKDLQRKEREWKRK